MGIDPWGVLEPGLVAMLQPPHLSLPAPPLKPHAIPSAVLTLVSLLSPASVTSPVLHVCSPPLSTLAGVGPLYG